MKYPIRWTAKGQLRSFLWLLSLLSLGLAILACGFSIGGSHIGYQPPPTTHLPAAQLRLEFHILAQYGNYSYVSMEARIFEVANSRQVSLAANASLTCNGTDIKPHTTDLVPPACPRQPPGGAYRIIYTDEHGATTTIVIPVPAGIFAILSPQDGATMAIPTNGTLPIRFTTPTPPANGSVAIDDVSVECSVSDAQPCGSVFANLRPTATATPAQGSGIATVAPLAASLGSATPKPGKTPTRGPIPTQPPTPQPGATTQPGATATVTQNGDTGTILLSGDYSEFQPAKGFLSMDFEVHVTPDPGAFAAVTVNYSDFLHTRFTWTR